MKRLLRRTVFLIIVLVALCFLLIGIDAKRFVRIVKKGDMVAVVFDVQRRDKDGQLLGYVYLPDGRMLNEEIVRAGYAKVITIPPNVKYRERFLEAHKEARMYRRGRPPFGANGSRCQT